MSLTGRKRRSDFGVKRPGLLAMNQARRRRSEHEQREDEARRLAVMSHERLRELVACIGAGNGVGLEVVAPPIGGLSDVYRIELVAAEVIRRRWPSASKDDQLVR